ncbi:MAG: alpha/beta hydrolase-fold protein [Promicromonosporaceae bacterium]|nr:alpha/beta hydrolase-fold protein [Promicromonosporaceae bacterium]
MALTGPLFLIVVALVAVVAGALLVVGWPRSTRRAHGMLARGAQVLSLIVAVVALLGVILNDRYLFYPTWPDLFGQGAPAVQSHYGGSIADLATRPTPGPGLAHVVAPATLPPLPDPHTRLQRYDVADPSSGARIPVLVYLPQGYDPASPHTYPVIEGLHGYPGVPDSFRVLNFLSTADQLTAEHRLAPSIFVIPTIDMPAKLDTECVDGRPGQPQVESWLASVVPAWTVHHFRVQTERMAWATLGYSYGGWCAAALSMRHPDVYGAAVVFEGYFRPDFSPTYDPLSPAAKVGFDLVRMAKDDPPPVAVWVMTSRGDAESWGTTGPFLGAAASPLDVTSLVVPQGGHSNLVFGRFVSPALEWLAQTLPGFRA